MPILRKAHNKQNPYVMINRNSVQNKELTFQARGLLSYILSLPEDWSISVKHLITQSPAGRDAIYSILKELKKYRYIKRSNIRNANQQFTDYEYLVYEYPFKEEEPLTDIPDTASADSEDPTLHNSIKNKVNLNTKESKPKKAAPKVAPSPLALKLLAAFQTSISKHLPEITRKVKDEEGKHFDKLLKDGYSEEEILKTINFSHTDNFWSLHVISPHYFNIKFSKLLLATRRLKNNNSSSGAVHFKTNYEESCEKNGVKYVKG